MADSERYEFTPEQEAEIGRLVIDRWGDNFQTGFDEITDTFDKGTGYPMLYSQSGPTHPVRRTVIAPDGTTVFYV